MGSAEEATVVGEAEVGAACAGKGAFPVRGAVCPGGLKEKSVLCRYTASNPTKLLILQVPVTKI